MTQSAATRPADRHSLLPADGQDDSSANSGFLARLEADGASPAVTQPARRSLWPGLIVGVLIVLLLVGGAIIWLRPDEPSVPPITHQTVDATTAKQQRAIQAMLNAQRPLSANAVAFAFITTPKPSPLAVFTPLAGLNTDIDALAATQTANELPAALAADWQSTGFARVGAVDADALDRIDTPPAHRRRKPKKKDSDAALLEMLMRRLNQAGDQ